MSFRQYNSRQLLQAGLIAVSTLTLIACSDSNDNSSGDPDTAIDAGQGDTDPADDDAGNGARNIPGTYTDTVIGRVFTGGDAQRTLYTFSNDTAGEASVCNGNCAMVWPPFLSEVEQETGDFYTIARNDGNWQWAFKGMPLYYYEGDASEGDVNGEGVNSVWYVARPDPIILRTTDKGEVLAGYGSINAGQNDAAQRLNYDGRTLYVFANDTTGISNCSGGCATAWPPLYSDLAAIGSNDYSIISRNDGTSQWAYQGQALYFYSGDNAPGDTTGDGVGGVWSVATP